MNKTEGLLTDQDISDMTEGYRERKTGQKLKRRKLTKDQKLMEIISDPNVNIPLVAKEFEMSTQEVYKLMEESGIL